MSIILQVRLMMREIYRSFATLAAIQFEAPWRNRREHRG